MRVDPEAATRSATARIEKRLGSPTRGVKGTSMLSICSIGPPKTEANQDQRCTRQTKGNSPGPEQQPEASCISSTERVQAAWGAALGRGS